MQLRPLWPSAVTQSSRAQADCCACAMQMSADAQPAAIKLANNGWAQWNAVDANVWFNPCRALRVLPSLAKARRDACQPCNPVCMQLLDRSRCRPSHRALRLCTSRESFTLATSVHSLCCGECGTTSRLMRQLSPHNPPPAKQDTKLQAGCWGAHLFDQGRDLVQDAPGLGHIGTAAAATHGWPLSSIGPSAGNPWAGTLLITPSAAGRHGQKFPPCLHCCRSIWVGTVLWTRAHTTCSRTTNMVGHSALALKGDSGTCNLQQDHQHGRPLCSSPQGGLGHMQPAARPPT